MKPNHIALAGFCAPLIILMMACQGFAQVPASTPAELQQRIHIGQPIRILLADGRRINGTAQGISSTEIRLRTSLGIENIHISGVRELNVRRNDAIWNGLITGLAIGALVGLVPDYLDDCEQCHDSLYYSAAVGAAVGIGVDLLLRSTQTLYRPSPPTQARVSVGFRSHHGIKVATVSFHF